MAGMVLWVLSLNFSGKTRNLEYGVSFSRFHSDELKLDWKQTYSAILDDLGVRRFRFSAHWPITEPEDGKYNFSELDFQIKEAEKRNATFMLAVGRRLPGWPECHEPQWLKDQILNIKNQNNKAEFRNGRLLKYIEATVKRYKDSKSLLYWQVENEPFLTFFSRSTCGSLDKDLLDKEIALVHHLDPKHKILITDSGEFGTWSGVYRRGDVFGTSLYLYIWNRRLGPLRYPITPAFFRIKQSLTRLIYGSKPSIIIELSTEPWLLEPIIQAPIDVQLDRMGIDKFNEMIRFASGTSFDATYFWGAEWWYWLKLHGHSEHWNRAKEIFKNSTLIE